MADGFDFADFREAGDFGADVRGAQRFAGVHGGNVELGKLVRLLAGRAALEEQALVGREVGVGFSFSFRALIGSTSATASISARRDISVAQSSTASPNSG